MWIMLAFVNFGAEIVLMNNNAILVISSMLIPLASHNGFRIQRPALLTRCQFSINSKRELI